MGSEPTTAAEVADGLKGCDYLADEGLATAVFLAMTLNRPLLLEGEPGVGKTETANALAAWTGGELIRLQCYEGIDVAQAVYEWDYSRQLLAPAHRRGHRRRHPGDRRRPGRRAVLRALPHSGAPCCGPSPPPRVRPRCC